MPSGGPNAVRHLQRLFESGTAVGLTDGQLLERVVAAGGNDRQAAETAFQVLVERHGPMVLRVCRCALGDMHDAEDAFQATFLTLATKARTIWVKDSLGPWLHAVALRVTARAKANVARRRLRERKAAELAATDRGGGDESGLDLAMVLHEEVGRLPQRYRAPIVLCYLEGLTHDAAAQHLDWPVRTLRARLVRGRELLRSRLEHRTLPDLDTMPTASEAKTVGTRSPDSLVATFKERLPLYAQVYAPHAGAAVCSEVAASPDLADERDDPASDSKIHPLILEAEKAFNRDLEQLLKERPGQWVAYHGRTRVGVAAGDEEAYALCVGKDIDPSEVLVRCIEMGGDEFVMGPGFADEVTDDPGK